jgi:hypothetical protein
MVPRRKELHLLKRKFREVDLMGPDQIPMD